VAAEPKTALERSAQFRAYIRALQSQKRNNTGAGVTVRFIIREIDPHPLVQRDGD